MVESVTEEQREMAAEMAAQFLNEELPESTFVLHRVNRVRTLVVIGTDCTGS
jgi:hypothetical protein